MIRMNVSILGWAVWLVLLGGQTPRRVAGQTVISKGRSAVADSQILRVVRALALCRKDIPAMRPVVDRAARLLVANGRFWAAGQPSMISELTGRAGGFMFLKRLRDPDALRSRDVVLYFSAEEKPVPAALTRSAAYTIVLGGRETDAGACPWFGSHAAEAHISPTLATVIPASVLSGEFVAALTRLGKMPVMYESIGAYGGSLRNSRRARQGLFFQDRHNIAPVSPGVIGGAWIDAVTAMLRRVETRQRGKLDTAGRWCAEAHRRGKRLAMYSMAHLFPDEIGKTAIGTLFESATWNAGFRSFSPPAVRAAEGDVFVHIGYQHPPSRLLRPARAAGARVVYVSVLEDRDFKRDPGVLWIDPMWPWADACVALKGYDIPVLASSGIVNGAIAWEIYRLTKAAMNRVPGR